MKLEREDLNAAVENRILSAEQADALQDFLVVRHQTPRAGAENFRVTNNFGEIFISLGLIIMFIAAVFSPFPWWMDTVLVMPPGSPSTRTSLCILCR